MNNLTKFKVVLKPDTAQLAYMDLDVVNLDIDFLDYPDGSKRIVIPNMTESLPHRYCHIDAFITSGDDLLVIAQIKDIVERLSKSPKSFALNILSTPYTRYDRVMFDNKSDGFGAKVFANMLNSIEMDFVSFLDCHSEVMIELVNNAIDIPQDALVSSMIDLSQYNLIAPDKGATKKNHKADIVFDKVRNAETGKITGMKVLKSKPDMSKVKHLVVDDICEGGRTFIESSNLFRSKISKTKQLDIYITHGIFSNNAIDKLAEKYDNIYTFIMKKSTYDAIDENVKSKVHVANLVTDL